MERLLPTLAVIVVAVAIGLWMRRRRPEAPTQPRRWPVPAQLDRDDFPGSARPWLVAVFSSTTCDGCARVIAKAEVLESKDVAYVVVAFQDRRDLHEKYGVEAAPTLVIADSDGVVVKSFVGDVTATDLWAALAEARAA